MILAAEAQQRTYLCVANLPVSREDAEFERGRRR